MDPTTDTGAEERADDDPTKESSDLSAGAVMMGNMMASNMSSPTMGGLGGGPIGAIAAGQASQTDVVEGDVEGLNLDALNALDDDDTMARGDRSPVRGDTGDDHVSTRQRDIEASEQNG